ncbi:MAG: hypothetical protein K6E29_04245 [Cyanobacteria bacterium RUI128]|nr:hypothetical protein [Cyanobacteria bacterium RUI128]
MFLINNDISFKSANITDNQPEKQGVVHQPISSSANKLERTPLQGDCIDFLPSQNKRPTIFSVFVKPVLNKINQKVKEHNQEKEIEKLNKTCERLIDNLSETRKTFQDVFMRKDITDQETLDMIKRYHDIEMIGITGSKEDYIKALFDEAKKNYGLENLPCEITIAKGDVRNDPKTLAYTDPLGGVTIKDNLKQNVIFNTIHHELRHVKQNYYAFNLDPDEFVRLSQPSNMSIPRGVFEYAYQCEPGEANIEPEYREFAQKSLESKQGYCAVSKSKFGYLAQWCEKDAFNAGDKMEALFRT